MHAIDRIASQLHTLKTVISVL